MNRDEPNGNAVSFKPEPNIMDITWYYWVPRVRATEKNIFALHHIN
jgi:hypothetical protein